LCPAARFFEYRTGFAPRRAARLTALKAFALVFYAGRNQARTLRRRDVIREGQAKRRKKGIGVF